MSITGTVIPWANTTFLRRFEEKRQELGMKWILRRGYLGLITASTGPIVRHLLRIEHSLQSADNRGPNERPLEYAFALDSLSLSGYQDVLDVGPGRGAWPSVISNCGYHVTAIDEMRGYWSGGIVNHHFYVKRDDVLAPKVNAKFGIITCLSTLEHIPNHTRAVVSMAKLLKPQGILILSFPYNEQRYVPDIKLLAGAGYGRNARYITQVFSRTEVNGWIRETGLELLQQRYYRVYTGDLWRFGKRLWPQEEVSVNQPHHLSGIVFRKTS
jgi:2-polyprenyl-3-methyl-5-hydroxy-6-metoxy-1,4-benzoquinol methylase